MIKSILPTIIISVLLATAGYIWFSIIEEEMIKTEKMFEPKMGTKVVIDKDTLTVVNYSSLMGTFTLSNGTEVDKSVIFNKSK